MNIDTEHIEGEENKDKIWYVVTDSSDPLSSGGPGETDEFDAIKERSEGESGATGESAPVQLELEDEGEYYIHVVTQDEAGNQKVEVYGPYRIDKDLQEESLW